MDTTNRLFFAFVGAAAVFVGFVWAWTRWKQRRSPVTEDLDQVLRQVAPGIPGTSIVGGGLRLFYRGLHGRLDFISDKTEIRFQTGTLLGQVVEVVPIGFPLSLFAGRGKGRLRARGSKEEYDRIFQRPADEQVLLDAGVTYELRMSPDGLILRFCSLPGSAAALSQWIACAFRIVDLIAGVDGNRSGR